MQSRTVLSQLVCVSLAAILAGCSGSGDHQDLRDYVLETKRRPKGQIEPLPSFRPYQSFVYSAVTFRSPFERPVAEKKQIYLSSNSDVKPDLTREKEFLENFNIASLKMVGTLERSGVLWALINDGEGAIHRVTSGNYIGKNHGRIVAASGSQIDVVEIVPDGLDGWVERPRTLKLEEKE